MLRILNLNGNNFDHNAGAIFGDALSHNTNLVSLDISCNRLGDLGTRNLVYPILMQSLKDEGILTGDNHVMTLDQTNLDQVRELPKLKVEMKDKNCNSALIALSIKDNYTT